MKNNGITHSMLTHSLWLVSVPLQVTYEGGNVPHVKGDPSRLPLMSIRWFDTLEPIVH